MIHKNRLFRSALLAVLCCGVSAVSALAQEAGTPPPPGDPGAHPHHGPPPNPLFEALDTNHDGVISADEMAKAGDSLKALLKPGATQLTREDVRPVPPHPHDGAEAEAAGDHPHPRPDGARAHNPPPMPEQAPAAADGSDMKPVPPAPADAARRGPQADGEGHHPHHGPPPSPVFDALDANHDGVISAEEMNNATASLKGLLKPGTSELRREDLHPEHPPRLHEN